MEKRISHVAVRDRYGPHAIAPALQCPKDDQRIATIVPGTDQTCDYGTRVQQIKQDRSAASSILHEDRFRHPGFADRTCIEPQRLSAGLRVHVTQTVRP
jgi:hypothetical protein